MISIPRASVGDLLQAIYDTEWPIRLEYVWDGGWVWVLGGHNGPEEEKRFPRVWFDNQLQGQQRMICLSNLARNQVESIPTQERDWVERGSSKTIEGAVSELAEALSRHMPDSDFTKKWNKP